MNAERRKFFHTAIFALFLLGILRPACSSKFHAEARAAAKAEKEARPARPAAVTAPAEIAAGIDHSQETGLPSEEE
jgi:hypothetical protein